MDTSEPLVIITSKVHEPRMRAHRVLLENGYKNWLMVVDNKEQQRRAMAMGIPDVRRTDRPSDIPIQDGIASTRQWIEAKVVKQGEWYVSLDDNVGGWTWLPEPYYSWDDGILFDVDPPAEGQTWRSMFETPCLFPQVVKIWKEMISECETRGTLAGGFSIENNFFFRSKKWQELGYVRAQNAVWKNTGLPFYYWRGAMFEDFIRSVDVVARRGSVLINRFLKPIKPPFEAGGIGTFEERRPNLVACCDELMKRYPGLLRPNKGQDYSLTFTFRSRERVDTWRRNHGYL